jgi:hypothetical protein
MTEAASVSLSTYSDGQFHTYVFEVGRIGHWAGCISSLRFDLATEPDVKMEIRAIRLE